MGVYAKRNRTDPAPRRATESNAEFFERIAGPFWDQVRDVINELWLHLPVQARTGARSRLLDRNSDTNVFSALWELYLHEMLLGSGCTVEVEQQVGTCGRNPDFLVARDGEKFIVEAIWTAQRLGETGVNQVPPQLIDAINRVQSPNFFVSYRLASTGSATPPQKRLIAQLTRWLASLEPDQVIADHERKIPLPRLAWKEAGWCLIFEAIPRDPDRRGDPTSRTIGIHTELWVDDESDRVLDAVKKKGARYGDLDLPFIVAVGHAALFPEDEDTESALYGTSVEGYAGRGAPGRMSDGYWTANYEHTHGRVSGVLTVGNPAPWTWTKKTPTLWQSSDPRSLPAPTLPAWEVAQLVEGQVEYRPASCLVHTVLGLPEHWPTGDAFPRRRSNK